MTKPKIKVHPHGRPKPNVRKELASLRDAWRKWRAEGMRGAEPVSPDELDRRIGLLVRAMRAIPK